MIFAYNKQNVGDTLMVIVKNDENKDNSVERKGAVARIQTTDGKTVAWNFFNVSDYLTIHGNGQVELSEKDIDVLNEQLKLAGFEERLVADLSPKFVVGHVKTCVDHPDSDHLHITEVEIDGGETLQIVCGAPNIEAGQKVLSLFLLFRVNKSRRRRLLTHKAKVDSQVNRSKTWSSRHLQAFSVYKAEW